MAMEISGNYNYLKSDYAEQVREKESLQRTERLEDERAVDGRAEEKAFDQAFAPRDEYIHSEESGAKPAGLYRLGQDENGNRKIFFEDPKKSGLADGKAQPKKSRENLEEDSDSNWSEKSGDSPEKDRDNNQPKISGNGQGKPTEQCTGSTDQVDREIQRLKEKKQDLERQIQSVSGEEEKVQKLKKELAQVEGELSRKDNDTYRRQHTYFY